MKLVRCDELVSGLWLVVMWFPILNKAVDTLTWCEIQFFRYNILIWHFSAIENKIYIDVKMDIFHASTIFLPKSLLGPIRQGSVQPKNVMKQYRRVLNSRIKSFVCSIEHEVP